MEERMEEKEQNVTMQVQYPEVYENGSANTIGAPRLAATDIGFGDEQRGRSRRQNQVDSGEASSSDDPKPSAIIEQSLPVTRVYNRPESTSEKMLSILPFLYMMAISSFPRESSLGALGGAIGQGWQLWQGTRQIQQASEQITQSEGHHKEEVRLQNELFEKELAIELRQVSTRLGKQLCCNSDVNLIPSHSTLLHPTACGKRDKPAPRSPKGIGP